jgi:hypothetical protein
MKMERTGVVRRVNHLLAKDPRGSNVAVSSVHLAVEFENPDPNLAPEVCDYVGIAWDFPALGAVVEYDEVAIADNGGYITSFRITNHS